MNIPHFSLATWKILYDAAASFRDIACWEWMSDSDVFGVQNPENGEVGYCCVLGELGEVLGLVTYLGRLGLQQHHKIQSGKIHAGSPDFAYSQCCLTAWFGSRRDLDDTDIKVVKQLGLKFRGNDTWPQFRSLQPGYMPWYLSESEAKFLTLCLEQARRVALDFEKDPDLLDAPRKNLFFVRVPGETTAAATPSPSRPAEQHQPFPEATASKAYEWNSQWLPPAPLVKAAIKPFPLDEIRLQRIKNASQERRGTWEIDAFHMPQAVARDGRPFFPYAFISADHDSGFLFSTVLADPSNWETEFSKTFLESIEGLPLLPARLFLRKEEFRELFAPIAARLGIQMELTKKLPAVDRAKREFLKYIAKRG